MKKNKIKKHMFKYQGTLVNSRVLQDISYCGSISSNQVKSWSLVNCKHCISNYNKKHK